MMGCGFSLMIPRAEAARNTDDLRTAVILGKGADDGGCGQKQVKMRVRKVSFRRFERNKLKPFYKI